MFWKLVFSKSWLRIRLRCSISICFKFLTAGLYVVTKDNLVEEGGGGQGGQSLPLPVPCSPTFRTFMPLYLPTLTLHCVAPIFRLIKRIKNPGLIFKLCQNLTFLFIFWPLVDMKWKFKNFNIWVFLTKYYPVINNKLSLSLFLLPLPAPCSPASFPLPPPCPPPQ